MIASGVAALAGNIALAGAGFDLIGAVTALAAGAIPAMIPEASEPANEYAGLITVIGFLATFAPPRSAGG
ncbi:hypothetical protein [Rhizobium sp. TRM95796]|uniref:hypothetical protein n=1 Tax=Rhizobium sp. TRM95796 TaxID=2979862 RepID=UPI0021E879DC|nr:hypothetical protein [Rhizobium sp. TRM95796]MCV3768947.1 hypothetical protein [Rhizobium sp. TRM95796]